MSERIPKEIWIGLIIVYKDGERVKRYTENLKPKDALVLLLYVQGETLHFYERDFSVDALNTHMEKL
jgi:macrodomain Ter protein organizer (MatP/YcbG family)